MQKIFYSLIAVLVLIGVGFIVKTFILSPAVSVTSVREQAVRVLNINTLSVTGVSRVTRDTTNHDTVLATIESKLFGERTSIEIPFTAQYGINGDDIQVTRSGGKTIIQLPSSELMSLELHMDQVQQMSEKGLFVFDNDEKFVDLQKELYENQKSKLEKDTQYLEQSRAYAVEALEKYFTSSSIVIK